MSTIRHSVIWTFASTNGANVVNFAVSLVLARMLTPSDIGIFSMTVMMVSIAHYFRDFGVGSYLQQAKEITPQDVAAASGMLITSSWIIAAVTFGLSWPIGAYMEEDGVTEVMQVLALGFAFIPFGAVTHSLLSRDFRAKEQAIVRAFSTVVYAVSALWLANQGHGYMSLAWANFINIIATALAYLPYRMKGVPWWPRFSGWGSMLHFGGGSLLGNGLAAVNNAISETMLGKLSGAHDVGLLTRSTGVTGLIFQVVGPAMHQAALPFMSKAHHAGEPLNTHLARAVELVTAVLWPALLGVAIFAEPLVMLLYGPQWTESASIVPLICMSSILGVPFLFIGVSLTAVGKAYWSALPAAIGVATKLIIVPSVYQGTLQSFAWGLLAASLVGFVPQVYLQQRVFGFSIREFLNCQRTSALLTLGTGVVAYGLHDLLAGQTPMATIVIAAVVLPSTWLAGLWLTRHPLWFALRGRMMNASPAV